MGSLSAELGVLNERTSWRESWGPRGKRKPAQWIWTCCVAFFARLAEPCDLIYGYAVLGDFAGRRPRTANDQTRAVSRWRIETKRKAGCSYYGTRWKSLGSSFCQWLQFSLHRPGAADGTASAQPSQRGHKTLTSTVASSRRQKPLGQPSANYLNMDIMGEYRELRF